MTESEKWKIKLFLSSSFHEFKDLRRKIKNEVDNEFFEVVLFEDRFPNDSAKFLQPRNAFEGLVEECPITIIVLGEKYSKAVKEEFTHAKLNSVRYLAYQSNGAKEPEQQAFIDGMIKDDALIGRYATEEALVSKIKDEIKREVKEIFGWGVSFLSDIQYEFEHSVPDNSLIPTAPRSLRVVCALQGRRRGVVDIFFDQETYGRIFNIIPRVYLNSRLTGDGVLFESVTEPILEVLDRGVFEMLLPIGTMSEEQSIVIEENIVKIIDCTYELARIFFNKSKYERVYVGYKLEGCVGAELRKADYPQYRLTDKKCLRDGRWIFAEMHPFLQSKEQVLKNHMTLILRYFNVKEFIPSGKS